MTPPNEQIMLAWSVPMVNEWVSDLLNNFIDQSSILFLVCTSEYS